MESKEGRYTLMMEAALCDWDRHNAHDGKLPLRWGPPYHHDRGRHKGHRPSRCLTIQYSQYSAKTETYHITVTPRTRQTPQTPPGQPWPGITVRIVSYLYDDSLLISMNTGRGASPSSSRAPSFVDTSYYDVELVSELHKRLLVVQAERERGEEWSLKGKAKATEEVVVQADAEDRHDDRQANDEDEDRHDDDSPHPSAGHTPFPSSMKMKEVDVGLARRWSWPSFMQLVSLKCKVPRTM